VNNALRRSRLNHYFAQYISKLYDNLFSASSNGGPRDEAPSAPFPVQHHMSHFSRDESELSDGGRLPSPCQPWPRMGSYTPLPSPTNSQSSVFSPSGLGVTSSSRAPTATRAVPRGLPTLDFSKLPPLAIDIGGTCAKMVYFQPPDGPKPPAFVTKESEAMSSCFPKNLTFFVHQREQSDDVGEASMPPSAVPTPQLSRNTSTTRLGSNGMRRHSASGESGELAGHDRRAGTLTFMKMPTNQVPKYIEFVQRNNLQAKFLPESLRHIPATGGGAYKYSALVEERLSVKLVQYKEMDCIMKGLTYLLANVPDSVFTYDIATQVPKPAKLPAETSAVYPFLLVNIGSGVSVLKCLNPKGDHIRVGGSPIGGGTFWGLVKALTNITSWEEIHELTRVDGPGDNTNLDLLVGDIYGFSATNLPQKLTVDTVASTFGKLGTMRRTPQHASAVGTGESSLPSSPVTAQERVGNDGGDGDGHDPWDGLHRPPTPGAASAHGSEPQAVDIVRSLLIMIANNVTQMAYLLAKVEHAENIFFTGGFVRENPIVWRQITRALQYWSGGAIQAHFFQHDGYLGALGALFAESSATVAGAGGAETPPCPPMTSLNLDAESQATPTTTKPETKVG
jgi:pantothenate kinase